MALFLEWLVRRESEGDVLERLGVLDLVLETVGARLVLIIEDGDRATSGDFDPRHLERLLWHLRSRRRVSFVLALDPVPLP